MSGLTPEASRLFRVRKTTVKMLHNRGYIVSENELVMTPESFQQQFGDNPTREMMTILVEKIDDPSDNLFVFFPEDTKVGVKPIRNYCNRMKDENVTKAILVVQEGITPFARQALNEMAPRYKIEHFKETELLVDITEHTLVPVHRVLSRDEKAALLKRYRIKDSQLPRMQVTDPIARYYGITRGQVVKIIRPSETAGRYVTYRAVIGEDANLPGKACPKKGDVAISRCLKSLATYHAAAGNCVALHDAQCVVIKSGVWGCVFPGTASSLSKAEAAGADNPTLAITTEYSQSSTPASAEIVTVASASIVTVSGASSPGNSAEYVSPDYDGGENTASVFSPNMEPPSSGVSDRAELNAGVAVAALVVAAIGVAVVRSHRREHRASSADSIRNLGRLEELSTPI
ncbi:hypothetical protein PybrP1_004681 [[Pythium] brassicae (nom. inval.)]|nr:hypothetical protein PybrP1_004681 [[Pythium] brassicae (nom. inval.)]